MGGGLKTTPLGCFDKGITMIIELAKSEDISEIIILQKLAYKSEAEIYNDFSIQPLTQTIGEIENEYKEQVFLKALDEEGKIIGSVRAYEKERTCFIGKLIVHPNSQNKGIGTALMHEIEKHFKQAERFELFTGERSDKNIYLYQKLGYQEFQKEKINNQVNMVYLQKLNETT